MWSKFVGAIEADQANAFQPVFFQRPCDTVKRIRWDIRKIKDEPESEGEAMKDEPDRSNDSKKNIIDTANRKRSEWKEVKSRIERYWHNASTSPPRFIVLAKVIHMSECIEIPSHHAQYIQHAGAILYRHRASFEIVLNGFSIDSHSSHMNSKLMVFRQWWWPYEAHVSHVSHVYIRNVPPCDFVYDIRDIACDCDQHTQWKRRNSRLCACFVSIVMWMALHWIPSQIRGRYNNSHTIGERQTIEFIGHSVNWQHHVLR